MALQFRRGNESDFVTGNLKAGEPAFTLDTLKTFVGTGSGTSELLNTARYATGDGSNVNKIDHAIKADSAITPAMSDNSTAIATTAFVRAAIAQSKLDSHPIGSVIGNKTGVNPGTYIGGTWAAYMAGQTPIGVNPNDPDFNTADMTGGEKTHTLTANEVPSLPIKDSAGSTYSSKDGIVQSTTTSYWFRGLTSGSGTDRTVFASGGGQPFNKMQPYRTMYFWVRTA